MDGLEAEFQTIHRAWQVAESVTQDKLDELVGLLDQAMDGRSIARRLSSLS